MIPQAFITEWSLRAPWPTDLQIEQDLILSRLMVEFANDPLLGGELVMRGGTCFHKLHLPAPMRYSEDLDYVRRTHSGIKPVMEAIRRIATDAGLIQQSYKQGGDMVNLMFEATPTSGIGRIRVKIEINVRETAFLREPTAIPLTVDSRWWAGTAAIPTFVIEELLGTKMRALYQRRKGRDLFDLWIALTTLDVDDREVVEALRHYMGAGTVDYSTFVDNLREKMRNRGFATDLATLVRDEPTQPLVTFVRHTPRVIQPQRARYNVDEAGELVIQRLGALLEGAPAEDAL